MCKHGWKIKKQLLHQFRYDKFINKHAYFFHLASYSQLYRNLARGKPFPRTPQSTIFPIFTNRIFFLLQVIWRSCECKYLEVYLIQTGNVQVFSGKVRLPRFSCYFKNLKDKWCYRVLGRLHYVLLQ